MALLLLWNMSFLFIFGGEVIQHSMLDEQHSHILSCPFHYEEHALKTFMFSFKKCHPNQCKAEEKKNHNVTDAS